MEEREKDNFSSGSRLDYVTNNENLSEYTRFGDFLKILGEQPFIGIAIEQDGVFKYVNNVLADITEFSVKEMLNWTYEQTLNVIHPNDIKIVTDRQKKRTEGFETVPYVFFRIHSKSGELKWIELYSKKIIYKGRNALLSFIIDVTDKKSMVEQ